MFICYLYLWLATLYVTATITDFMRENKANHVPRVTVVLTHCDTTLLLGANAAEARRARLHNTVQKAMEYGSMVCAIIGKL